jgi:hypothetical protein
MSGVHQKYTRPHHIAKRGAGLAKRLLDDFQATSSLHADVGVYMIVRPDRSRRGNEDETLVANSPAKADRGLQWRSRADALPHRYKPNGRARPAAFRAPRPAREH